jgi:hypothetical protein
MSLGIQTSAINPRIPAIVPAALISFNDRHERERWFRSLNEALVVEHEAQACSGEDIIVVLD